MLCVFFSLDVGGDGFEELQQARAKAQKNNGTCEVEGTPIHFFFCHRKAMVVLVGRFWQWLRLLLGWEIGEVSMMAEVAPRLACRRGLGDGQNCSWAEL
jgi:hypothetical protein